jgi:hypothetical protein
MRFGRRNPGARRGGARKHSRRFLLALAAGAALLLSLSVVAIAALVSLPGSTFEIDDDANLTVQTAGNLDWANVSETRKADTPSGQSDESFGNGTKEDTSVPSVVTGGIPPNKSDLKFFGVYQEGTDANGFLNLYWSRVQDPSGTTNMDFELNHKRCTATDTSGCSSNGLTPLRTSGDILIQYDLSNGGTVPQLFVSKWIAVGDAGKTKADCEAANALPCWGKKVNLTASGDAAGSINTSPIAAANSDGLGAQSARTFGEAQAKLSALLGSGNCEAFGSAYLKSRSSDSFTAALKDFVPPAAVSISTCGKVDITKVDDLANPLGGAVFTLYTDNAPIGGSRGAEDTATTLTCTTDSTTGKCTIDTVPFGEYWVVETTTPSGYNTAADQHVSISSGAATASVSFTDIRNKGSVTVVKKDDAGNLMGGVKFTLKGTSDFGDTVDTNCTTASTGADTGKCTMSNIPLGSYTLDEDATTLPSGYGKDPTLPKTVQVTSDGQVVTVNVTNPRTHRVIVIVCHEGTNSLNSSDVVGPDGTTTKTSIATVPSALATKNVTEADLCGIGGASFGGLDHGDKSLTAKIASH